MSEACDNRRTVDQMKAAGAKRLPLPERLAEMLKELQPYGSGKAVVKKPQDFESTLHPSIDS